jgi:DNA repair protein RecO (recombination protein O)
MANITTLAIVLRHAEYRENDRMLTLLTPAQGRVDALARGCRRPGNALLSGAELFAFGEYVLFQGKGKATVVSCDLKDSFYPLREDYDKLRYASYLLQACGAQAQPAERAEGLFTLLLRSLKRLCYMEQLDKRAVTAAFLLLDAALSGYRPRLHHCVRCGKTIDADGARLFDIEEGGLCCRECESALLPAVPVSWAQVLWMRDVLQNGIEKTDRPPQDAPLPLLMRYMEARLETHLPSGKGLQ